MYTTSEAYKAAIIADTRTFRARIGITTPLEQIDLTDADLKRNTLKLNESALGGDKVTIGETVMADLHFAIVNDSGVFDDVQFNGAVVTPEIDLEVTPGTWETVPLGVFNIDESSRPFAAVSLQAFDNMVKFERPFSDVSVSYPCSAVTLLTTVCAQCGVTLSTTAFLNDDYEITAAPTDEMSCRDVVGYVAQLACCFARCDRLGQLELTWFKNPAYVTEGNLDFNDDNGDGGNFDNYNDRVIDGGAFVPETPDFTTVPSQRYDYNADDDPVIVTGVTFETDEEILLAGTARYTVDVSGNPLIQHDVEDLLDSLLEVLQGFTFMPYTLNWIGDPAVQAGDMAEHTSRTGRPYRTIIGSTKYAFRGKAELSAGGASETKSGYKTQAAKQFTTLKRKLVEKQVQLDALDQAIINATSLIAGALGGYAIVGTGDYEGNFFVADDPDIEAAVKVWRWNIGGFGYSSDGVDGPYETAITADGSIVAAIITADMIRTGMLQSLNGNSWFDLDNGEFAVKTDKLQASLMGSYHEVIDGDDYTKIWAQGLGFHGRDENGDPIGDIAEDPENLLGGLFSQYFEYKIGEDETIGNRMLVLGDILFDGDIYSNGDITAYGELTGRTVISDSIKAVTNQINITIGSTIVGYIDEDGFHNGAP